MILDPTRPINDNCGWEHVATDLTTFHDYSDSPALTATCSDFNTGILGPKGEHENKHEMFVKPLYYGSILLDPGSKHTPGAPVICSEFGGVNIVPEKGMDSGERDWGYTTASDPEDFLGRLERLVSAVVKGRQTCGMVYTQLYVHPLQGSKRHDAKYQPYRCDIEQEVNGLYAYDRKEKVSAARIKAIFDSAHKFYHEHVAPK